VPCARKPKPILKALYLYSAAWRCTVKLRSANRKACCEHAGGYPNSAHMDRRIVRYTRKQTSVRLGRYRIPTPYLQPRGSGVLVGRVWSSTRNRQSTIPSLLLSTSAHAHRTHTPPPLGPWDVTQLGLLKTTDLKTTDLTTERASCAARTLSRPPSIHQSPPWG